MKILLIILLSAFAFNCYSQSTLPLRADTVLIEKTGGNANLKIKDSSRNTAGGILTNIGGGVYTGKKPKKLNDSTIVIGNDTLAVGGNPTLDWCNVFNFGADKTGSLDASVYIQSLINGGCRYIYLPKGEYLISNTIQLRDSVTIKGDGRNNTIIKLTTNIPAFHTGQIGHYSQFLDFDIKGNKTGGATNEQEGIFCDSTASVYINNVGGYNLGGFAIRFRADLYGRPYPGTGLVGSIISDCNFESCYGGIKLDTNAEYVGISNSVMIGNTYGLHLIGGNSRVSNCNMSSNTYGIYMTNGPNDHHGNAIGNNINHNTYNIYMDSVPGGYTFVGNHIFAGTNQLYIKQSRNIEFLGGDIVGTGAATFINNDTTVHFLDVNMRTKPTFSITGNAPNIINTRETQGFAFYDAVNAKRFDMSYTNDSATFTGNLYMLRVPTARVRIGTPSLSSHKLVVNYPNNDVPNKTLAAFGVHISNGIAVTIGDIDTMTSTNSATLMARTYQFHKRIYCKDDNLTLGSWKAGFNFFGLHANNTTNISNPSGQSYNCVINSLGYNQFPGITSTSTVNASSSVNNTVNSTMSFTVLTNNGGSSLLNLKGFYGGYGTYIQMGARDTIESYAAYNSGAHEINAAARLKTFYHHYMHTNPGQTNWGVYQEGASVGNYFNGTIGVNTNAPVYGLFVNRSIGQSKDSSELVASVTSESIQIIDTITGKFKRIPLSNLSAKNISNASLTANGNYSHNWAGKNLLIDSINIQQLLARGVDVSTGNRLNVYYTSVGTGAAGRPLTAGSALRNTANSADSILNEFRVQSEQTKMHASTTAGNKTTELYLNPFSINISAADSVLLKGVESSASADSILAVAPVNSFGQYKIKRIPNGLTSINSQTGPAITFSSGVATYVTNPSGNTLAYNVDPTSDVLPRTIDKQYTDANNTGTSETDLFTKTVSGGTLNTNGQSLHFVTSGSISDATATAVLKIYFAGNEIGSSGTITLGTVGSFRISGEIIRTGTTTGRASFSLDVGAGTTYSDAYELDLTGLDWTTGNILKLTGQAGGAGGGSNDITGKLWVITYQPN